MSQGDETYKFRKLLVWQRSIEFVAKIYLTTSRFPSEERFGLVDQLRRAATSIVLNIAEGSGSGSDLEFNRFLKIARRSVFEVVAGLDLALKLKFQTQDEVQDLISEAGEISAMISGLRKKLIAQDS